MSVFNLCNRKVLCCNKFNKFAARQYFQELDISTQFSIGGTLLFSCFVFALLVTTSQNASLLRETAGIYCCSVQRWLRHSSQNNQVKSVGICHYKHGTARPTAGEPTDDSECRSSCSSTPFFIEIGQSSKLFHYRSKTRHPYLQLEQRDWLICETNRRY